MKALSLGLPRIFFSLAIILATYLTTSALADPACPISFVPSNVLTGSISQFPNYPYSDATFHTVVQDNLQPIPAGTYLTWCVDADTGIDPTQGLTVDSTIFTGNLFPDSDTNLNSEIPADHPSACYVSPAVWQQVNYILNHQNGAYFWEVQVAINSLVGGPPLTESPPWPPSNPTNVEALLSNASTYAASWSPQCGDVVGAIFSITNEAGTFLDFDNPVQLEMLEIPIPCIASIGIVKQVACLEPTNNCGSFGSTAYGYIANTNNGPGFCYQITVTNNGGYTLSNISVMDNMLGDLTTNFFANTNVTLAPGAFVQAYFKMAITNNCTNTAIVTGHAVIGGSVTNIAATNSATVYLDHAGIASTLTLSSACDLDGNAYDSHVSLPYYSTNCNVTINLAITNTGSANLTNVTITSASLVTLGCGMPSPFNLAAGASTNFSCNPIVTSVAGPVSLTVSVNGMVTSDTNHCGIYDITSTNIISASSGCSAAIDFTSDIEFSISTTNQYVTTNLAGLTLYVSAGTPTNIAILIDNTNFSAATWTNYTSSNITVNLGSSNGQHDIWVGLRAAGSNAVPEWQETTLILDTVTPSITITNPANNASLASSRVNVGGNFTASSLQEITVNGILAFINGTNFEAVNVPLAPGTNTISAVAQDFTGTVVSNSITLVAATNLDGSLTDPVQLQATPVAGFYPLPVTFSVQTNVPGTLQSVLYDFNGDGITDFTTNTISNLTNTYTTNGQFFPVVTIQTSAGRFSSLGGWNADFNTPTNQSLRINVQAPPILVTNISITDPIDLKCTASSNLYVLSGTSATITEFDTNYSTIRSLSGIGLNPSGLDVDSYGNVYVTMSGSNQVWRFTPTSNSFQIDTNFGMHGYIGLTNGSAGTNTGEFNAPFDVAVSSDGQTIFVSDSGNNRIQQFNTNGVYTGSFGVAGSGFGQFNTPKGLTCDKVGYLYIVDSGNNRIVLAQLSGVIGTSGTNGNAPGQFNAPLNIAVGRRGIYVAETENSRLQGFDTLITAAPPTPFEPRFVVSSELGLNQPNAAAEKPDFTEEMIYIADTGNNRVSLVNLPQDNPLPVWTNMIAQVINGDIVGAISCFATASQDQYRQSYLSTGASNLSAITSQIPTMHSSLIENSTAEYYFTNSVDGQIITFPIEFIKENGIWKILEY